MSIERVKYHLDKAEEIIDLADTPGLLAETSKNISIRANTHVNLASTLLAAMEYEKNHPLRHVDLGPG